MTQTTTFTTTITKEITLQVEVPFGALLTMYRRLLLDRDATTGPLMGLVSAQELPIALAAIAHYACAPCRVYQRGPDTYCIESQGSAQAE